VSLKHNALANITGQVAVAAIQILVIPQYVGYVGVEAYGLVGFYVSLQAIAQLLDLGMSPAVNRQMSRAAVVPSEAVHARDFLRTTELLYAAAGAALGIGLFAAAPAIANRWIRPVTLSEPAVTDALRMIAVLTAIQWPLTFYQGALLGLGRARVMNAIRVCATIVSAGGAIAVLQWFAPTVGALFRWQIVVSTAQVIAAAVCAWHFMPATPRRAMFRMGSLAGVWQFALGMTAVTATATVLTQMDKVVLSRIVPLSQFGYYSIAGVIGNGLSTLVGALFATMFPMFSRLVAAGDSGGVALQYRRMWGVMTVLTVPFAVVGTAFSRQVLLLWTGSQTTAEIAAPVMALLILGSALNGMMTVVYALQLARGDTGLALRLNLLLCAIGGPLLLVLAPRYGTVGAAAVWPVLNAVYLAVGVPATSQRFAPAAVSPWILRTVVAPAAACSAVVLLLKVLLPGTAPPIGLAFQLGGVWLLALLTVMAVNKQVLNDLVSAARAVLSGVQRVGRSRPPSGTMNNSGGTSPAGSARRIELPPARGRLTPWRRILRGALGALGLFPFALVAHARGLPGLEVRLRIAGLAARLAVGSRIRVRSTLLYDMVCFPMDSTRYFEFEFMWRRLKSTAATSYLDVSSPRLLPTLFINSRAQLRATLINPDEADLRETRNLAVACGVDSRCRFENGVIGELSIPDASFDVITSISVVEHIRDDRDAVERMWRALKPGGRLLLSMPCAAQAEEQFINIQNYEFAAREGDGWVFHQHVYDEGALQRIFEITGAPTVQEIYGEQNAGFHLRLYEQKWTDADYPFWKEPWFMTTFSRFQSIAELPGEGVVLLEFVK
jgi:O-antigen/teichoic acid export membrane protein/SAM-dependent methyltransferase